ncbi:MAG: Glycosyl transferase group 1 [Candidatus Moranbacteria bacterium GW2011_GWD2_36_12]|nr:MAG: Glycosyl transferase group 1 [Candidatus Moranbacteria bacterium GW2011_GWD2_36_12]KKQ05811.1 MAG: Glycosyl transferase group 1 [Candidatus Moranbacteria bacterium GW2011_GWE2_36_40]
MKILHTVEFYHPSIGGMQEVVKQLSERLVVLGHDVTVATTKLSERRENIVNGVNLAEFEISGNFVRGLSGEVEKYEKFLIESDFDVITNFAAQQWATDISLNVLDKIRAKKIFVPTGFSGLYAKEYVQYFESMKSWMKKYDMNVFLSDDYRDVNFAKENGIEKRILISNGAGEDEFLKENSIDIRKKLGISKDNLLILHVGSHTGVKGHAETIEIFKKAKIKNSTLLIIGNICGIGGCYISCNSKGKFFNRSPFRFFDKKKILVKELSREETVAAYKSADLFLFPSNIECSPIVLFECMASKTPFLTSDVGNSREIAEWSKSGILLPTDRGKDSMVLSRVDIEKSSEMLISLAFDREKRQKMSEVGFIVWKEKYSWEKITRQYEKMYKNLLEK